MAKEEKFYWIKLREDFFEDDSAIDYLMSQENGSDYVILYQLLCLKTSNTQGRLYSQVGEMIVPYNVEKIRRLTKYFSTDTIVVALELFKKCGLIYLEKESGLLKIDIESMVGSESSNKAAIRKRKSREQQKIAENRALWSGETTSCDKMSHKNVTKCHIENKSIEYREKNISTNVDISEKSQKNSAEEVVVDLDDGFKDFSKRFIDEWNSIPELSTIRQLRPNSQRYKCFHARYLEVGEDLMQLIDKIKCSSFLRGKNNRGWKATLEWVMNPNNFDKVMENKYADKGKVNEDGTRRNGEDAKVGEPDDSAILGEIFGVDMS
jgi:hypothetical protein